MVPSQYSEVTMRAITLGAMTSSSRREIVQAVTSKMLKNCKFPTPDQVETVSSKIVNSIKGTRDSLGTGHVSIHFHLL